MLGASDEDASKEKAALYFYFEESEGCGICHALSYCSACSELQVPSISIMSCPATRITHPDFRGTMFGYNLEELTSAELSPKQVILK